MRNSDRRLFLCVVVVLGSVLTHSTFAWSGDEPHYLAIARSIAFEIDIDLANNADEAICWLR